MSDTDSPRGSIRREDERLRSSSAPSGRGADDESPAPKSPPRERRMSKGPPKGAVILKGGGKGGKGAGKGGAKAKALVKAKSAINALAVVPKFLEFVLFHGGTLYVHRIGVLVRQEQEVFGSRRWGRM